MIFFFSHSISYCNYKIIRKYWPAGFIYLLINLFLSRILMMRLYLRNIFIRAFQDLTLNVSGNKSWNIHVFARVVAFWGLSQRFSLVNFFLIFHFVTNSWFLSENLDSIKIWINFSTFNHTIKNNCHYPKLIWASCRVQ